MAARRPDKQLLARLAYTNLFEQVTSTAVNKTAEYGELVSVKGAAGVVTVTAPPFNSPSASPSGVKDAAHFGVVNADGAQEITVAASGGLNINGGSTITIPAEAGAFAYIALSVEEGQFVALVGGAGSSGGVTLPETTAEGPTPDELQLGVNPTLVVSAASITIPVGRNALILADCQFNNNGGEAAVTSNCALFIYEGASPIEARSALIAPISGDGIVPGFLASLHTVFQGDGGAHVFSVYASGADHATGETATMNVPVNGARITVVQLGS